MENFSITSRLTKKEYAKTLFIGIYKKPAFILATVLGIYYMLTLILDYFKIVSIYTDTPYFEIVCGLILLLAPPLIVVTAVRQFTSNPCFENDITYSFNEKGMTTEGLTFKSEFIWTHIIKHKEIGNFIILYQNVKAGYFIDKRKLTLDQLQFIKTKVNPK